MLIESSVPYTLDHLDGTTDKLDRREYQHDDTGDEFDGDGTEDPDLVDVVLEGKEQENQSQDKKDTSGDQSHHTGIEAVGFLRDLVMGILMEMMKFFPGKVGGIVILVAMDAERGQFIIVDLSTVDTASFHRFC